LLFLLVVSLNYAVRLSGMSSQVKLLAQEVALLRARMAVAEARGAGPTPQLPAESAAASRDRE
jgi:hypothetical protein